MGEFHFLLSVQSEILNASSSQQQKKRTKYVFDSMIAMLESFIAFHLKFLDAHDCWHQPYLDVTEVDELPALEAGPDGQIHVLHRGPVLPPPSLVHRGDAPHAGGAWLPKLLS